MIDRGFSEEKVCAFGSRSSGQEKQWLNDVILHKSAF